MKMRKIRPRRRRGSWLDLLLLFLLAAALAGGGYAVLRRHATESGAPIGYLVLISAVPEDLLGEVENRIVPRAEVRSGNGTAVLGEVAECSVLPHKVPKVVRDRIEWVEVPGRYDLRVSVRAVAAETDRSYRVHDIRIAAGVGVDLRIGGLYATGCRILSVFGENEGSVGES